MRSEFPSGWTQRRLGDCGTWLSGGTPPKSRPEYWGGDIPWVGPKDLHKRYIDRAEEHLTELGTANGTRLVPKDSILVVVRSMALAKKLQIGLTRRQVAFNQDIKAILPAEDVRPRFLFYALWGGHDAIHALVDEASHGTKRLRTEVLADYRVALPTADEQERIVAVLGALDDRIDSNTRVADRSALVARTEFRRIFGGRIEGAARLGDHVSVVRGRSYKSSELVPSERALITLKSVRPGGGYNPGGLKAYAGGFKRDQVVRPGELVVAHTDLTQSAAVVGKPALVPDRAGFTELIASLDLAVVRPITGRVSVPFLYHLMLEPAFQQHAYGHANGSTVLHLAKEAVPSFGIELPDRKLLDRFDELAAPLLELAHGLLGETRTLAQLRDELLPKLVSGEIRVPDTADPDEVIGPTAEHVAV